jgi:acyl-CoA thioesterase II
MTTLQDASAISVRGDALYATLAEDWNIWGPIGGYVAAVAIRAAGVVAPEGHRPVTLSCQFLARGRNGETEIKVDTLKPGSTACFGVTLIQDGKIILTAQVWTTAKTEGPRINDSHMPDVPMPDRLEPFADQLARFGHAPIPFWLNVDGRQVDFRAPGIPDPRGCRTERWLRYKDWETTRDPFLEACRALIGIDTHIWAAHNRGLTALPNYVAPSLDLAVWFHDSAPHSEWQLIDARADVAGHALMAGSAQVWSIDGRLIASGGGQCLVVPVS